MEIKFNIEKTKRKELAHSIAEIIECDCKYMGAPQFFYQIGFFTLSKDCVLSCNDDCDEQDIQHLLEQLTKRGYHAEISNHLTISIPKETLNEQTLTNLDRILENKGTLIKHALQTDSLEYTVTETEVQFPWFSVNDSEDADAYSRFITALIDMAKNQKRINNKPDTSDNEKYTFRCFLLRLGFIGGEFKGIRKVLLRNLSGSSAFRHRGADNETSD